MVTAYITCLCNMLVIVTIKASNSCFICLFVLISFEILPITAGWQLGEVLGVLSDEGLWGTLCWKCWSACDGWIIAAQICQPRSIANSISCINELLISINLHSWDTEAFALLTCTWLGLEDIKGCCAVLCLTIGAEQRCDSLHLQHKTALLFVHYQ